MDDRPELDPARALIRLGPVLVRHQLVLAKALGTDLAGVVVLDLTDRLGSMSVGALADRVGLSPSATSRVIDRLERAGLADRTADRDVDGRRVLVGPSARASLALRRAHEELAGVDRHGGPAAGPAEDAVVRWLLRAGDAVVRHDREAESARRFVTWLARSDTP
jgi:DNA-binding MarR family transcriptional regulator